MRSRRAETKILIAVVKAYDGRQHRCQSISRSQLKGLAKAAGKTSKTSIQAVADLQVWSRLKYWKTQGIQKNPQHTPRVARLRLLASRFPLNGVLSK